MFCQRSSGRSTMHNSPVAHGRQNPRPKFAAAALILACVIPERATAAQFIGSPFVVCLPASWVAPSMNPNVEPDMVVRMCSQIRSFPAGDILDRADAAPKPARSVTKA